MDSIFQGAMSWLHPMADTGLGDYVFFKLINTYLNSEINTFGMELMKRAMNWVSVIAMTAVTLWVMLAGYRIATGQSRESAMATMVKATKIVVILGIASVVGANGAMLHKTMTENLDQEIHGLFTGDAGTSAADAIDENLAYTQLALAAVDVVRVSPTDPESLDKKNRAMFMAGFGAASPAMAAGAMLLLFKFTMAFLVGVGPIFILALMFEQTKDLFKKWLFYVIGTLFSMSMLSVVSAMVLKLSTKVAIAMWVSKSINGFLLTDTEGLSSQALQQGGIGLLLTVLIVTMPTVAAALWQGNMGTFMAYSAFSSGASPGPQGQPPGAYTPQQIAPSADRSVDSLQNTSHAATKSIAGAGPTETASAGSRGLAGQNMRG
ncbi:TrbL/VirB6 family protein [Xanthomonas graminis]|uniref:Type IV secretion system protein VirB6 n=1 Tax=Xanthomonas graminis pv. phlei TaxID=487906 RepID=A0A0K3A2S4_9XANT|nr:type IV secretion system protein [Xanthomonas translucens]UKE66038.1 type IV secretion system protein [Xanthomonas translucens pv. phlei]CTP92386.1 type IV secretion system protein VirB6 [Xanthomonas translucens pv. phlei]